VYRNPSEPVSESAVSPWMASILMRRGGAWQRFALYYRQLSAMPRRWRRQLRRKAAVGLGSAALVLALAGPIMAAPARQPAAPDATIVVVNGEVANVNNNKCGLIEAIINARTTNANAMRPDCAPGNLNGPDTISLPAGGEFVLTSAHNEQFGYTGLPVITSAVTIDGHGATIRRADGDTVPAFRILAVDNAGNLTLRNVTISNGDFVDSRGIGGGVLNKNVLTVESSTVTGNRAHSGGGIYSAEGATTTIVASILRNNVAEAYHSWANSDNPGGGIFAAGDVVISNSLIDGNEAGHGAGIALGSERYETTATITDTTISHNRANGYRESWKVRGGGGINVGSYARVTIADSRITDNSAIDDLDGGWGGGLAVWGQATITGSAIIGNVAYAGSYVGDYNFYDVPSSGGGVVNHGSTLITDSTISGNSATSGTACGEYDCYVVAGVGGGISNKDGDTLIVNSTISGNTAYLGAGLGNGNGGDNRLDLVHTTVTGNGYADAYYGGGIFSGCSSLTTIRGSVVSGNSADHGREVWAAVGKPCATGIVVNGFNVFGHSGNSGLVGLSKGATDIVPTAGLNAILGPLADNGGPTMTHALPANSPALDRAPNASCTAAPVNGVDQRGQPRNQNATGGVTNNECDAGSFERAGAPVAQLSFYLSATGNGTVGGVAFAPGDIIQFTPAGGWSMYFDASDVGITKNVTAFEIEGNGHILLSLAAPQNVPGVGNVAAQDVLRFTPTSTGNNTAGAFTKAFDGSDNLLSTAGEKIDALGLASNGRLALSTSGAAAVMRPDNSALKAQDEDVLGFNLGNGQWSEFFNGTAIPGLAAEDVNALWIDPATGDLYISIVGAFNLGGIAGDGRDIVKLTPSGAPGGYTPSLFWDGSAAGFPVAIDGLEMAP